METPPRSEPDPQEPEADRPETPPPPPPPAGGPQKADLGKRIQTDDGIARAVAIVQQAEERGTPLAPNPRLC